MPVGQRLFTGNYICIQFKRHKGDKNIAFWKSHPNSISDLGLCGQRLDFIVKLWKSDV